MTECVTDEDLSLARRDLAFRQKFLADHLESLLAALNQARRSSSPSPALALQVKEGVDLAVKLAEMLNAPGRRSGSLAA